MINPTVARKRDHRTNPNNDFRIRIPSFFDENEVGYWAWSSIGNRFEVDPHFFKRYGYSEQDVCPLDMKKWEEMLHPKDRDIALGNFENLLNENVPSLSHRHRIRVYGKKWIWFYSCGQITSRTTDGKPLRISGVIHEISDVVRAEEEIRKRDRLLDVSNHSAELLLYSSPDNFDDDLLEVLDGLGFASEANRVFIWRYKRNPCGCFRSDYAYEWSAKAGAHAAPAVFPGSSVHESEPKLEMLFGAGECICYRTQRMPQPERDYLCSQGIQSALIAPIFCNGVFWGILCLGHRNRNHRWNGWERNILKSVGLQVAGTLRRHAAERILHTEQSIL